MEEVFGINIRPINHALVNNFFSSEFSIPGDNNTKIYRMESSTLRLENRTSKKRTIGPFFAQEKDHGPFFATICL